MSFTKKKEFEQRISSLSDDTRGLNADVEDLTKVLQLHHELMTKERKSSRSILRKEIGGSIWENGAEGKLRHYKSNKNTDDAAKPPAKSACASVKKSTSKSVPPQSRPKTHYGSSKERTTKIKEGRFQSSVEPSFKMAAKSERMKQVRVRANPSHIRNDKTDQAVDSDTDEDAEVIASSYSHAQINLNETYTKDICSQSPYKLPTVPEKTTTTPTDCSVNPPDKRSRVLKKMIKKLDVDHKLGEYKTSETDSDSLSTPQQTKSSNSCKHTRYCDPDVLAWLMNQGLRDIEKCARIFSEHKVSMAELPLLTQTSLQQMGITEAGTLAKLTSAVEELKKQSNRHNTKQTVGAEIKEKKKSSIQVQKQRATFHDKASERIHKIDGKSSPKITKSEHPSSCIKDNHGQSIHKKNTVKSSHIPKKRVAQSRPYSAMVHYSKPVSKPGTKIRPNSASLMKVGRDSDRKSFYEEGDLKEHQHREPVPDKEAALSSLIAIRPLAVPSSQLLKTDEVNQEIDAIDGKTFGNDAEARLQFIEQQINELQKELMSPVALSIISSLQMQLQQIHKEVLLKNKDTTDHHPQDSLIREQELAQLQCSSAQSTCAKHPKLKCNDIPEGESFSNDDPATTMFNASGLDDMADIPKTRYMNPKPFSMSLSKTELLREVRKQNDAHRKHIRHLESELNRLKFKDPMRNCEIPEKDIHFSHEDLLGEGAFSEVFKGTYQGSEVAVKRLKVPLSLQDKNYFTAEVSLLRELRHPHVVLLLGVCTTSQHPLMILEYMAQGSLYSYLHDVNNLQLDHAGYYQIAKDMALGMNYLHRHTPVVLHLDLKSMNVLLSTHLQAKIADFGFSKLRHDANQTTSKSSKVHTAGTPAWMAPELLNTGDISTKSDVYSYSIILWEMLTRKHPYEGCSMFQVIERTRTNKRLEIPSYCPSGLRKLISSCWSHNPAKRPSFKDVLSALEKLQFPGDWRTLFAEVGIPESALNNVESSRTLIDIVTLTLDDVPRHPSDIPILDLEESDDELHEKNLTDSEDDWEDVTGDDEDSERDDNSKNPYRPPDVPRLILNLSGDLSESKKLTATRNQDENACQINPSCQNGDIPLKKYPLSPTTVAPQLYIPSPMMAEAPDLLTHTTNMQKHNVHDSFMKQLEKALKDPQPLNNHRSQPSDRQKSMQPSNSNQITIKASELILQKERLRSTDKPHPCQLRDLSQITEEGRRNLFDVLKKAVNSRRLLMNDGKSVEQSLSAEWSLDG